MSIKINVGVNKKIGLPDYGSAGAMCNIEIEADNLVLDNPEQFLHRVRDAFDAARLSVGEELTKHRPNRNSGHSNQPSASNGGSANREPEPKREYRSEYRNSENSNSGNQPAGQKYVASAKQLNYIFQLCKSVNGLDKRRLEKFCDHRWGRGTAQLTPKQASELIDILRNGGEGVATI
jgi:hypothetical protein